MTDAHGLQPGSAYETFKHLKANTPLDFKMGKGRESDPKTLGTQPSRERGGEGGREGEGEREGGRGRERRREGEREREGGRERETDRNFNLGQRPLSL